MRISEYPVTTHPPMKDDLAEYEINGETFYVSDIAEEDPQLYRHIEETNNPRTMASHNGPLIYQNKFVRIEYNEENGLYQAYHPWTGREGTLIPREFDENAIKLEKVDAENGFW